MAHPRARLSVFSRQLLVKRVIVDGWPAATVAEQLGISRATAYKWVRRYRAEGLPGLEDRSSRTASIAAATARRGRCRDHSGPGPPALRSARLAPLTGSSALDDLRRPAACRLNRSARHRPGDRRPGPLRGVPSRERSSTRTTRSSAGCPTAAAGESSARASRPRIGASAATTISKSFVDDASRYAVVVPVADERGRERFVGRRAGGRPVRRGRGPDRADADRQRGELS